MAHPAAQSLPVVEAFDEKQFYLDEFRGHTLLFSLFTEDLARDEDYERLAALVRELLTNDTRVIALIGTPDAGRGKQVLGRLQRRLAPLIFLDETAPLFPQRRARTTAFALLDAQAFQTPDTATALLTAVWSILRRGPLFVGVVAAPSRAAATDFARHVAVRLRVHKLVVIEPDGGLTGTDGRCLSFLDESMLAILLGAGQSEWAGLAARRATVQAVRATLLGGVASVNLCTFGGVARELFTYEGSGTLFTLADYCTVQRLGIDDFEHVERLIVRGQREGILKLRTAEEIAGLLINGYGATIGEHHFAGICALNTAAYQDERAGEIACLYTITRFKGEGVGARLLARVLTDARDAGLAYVFATTTEERAQSFFETQGFRRGRTSDVPAAKWDGYDPQRKAQVTVLRLDLLRPQV